MADKLHGDWVNQAREMKNSWPKVTARISSAFSAWHSLPSIGVSDRHLHKWDVSIGYTLEINPHNGCTKPMQEMKRGLDELLSQLEGSYLNDLFRFPPTSETIACWIMARLPPYYDTVIVEAYDGYKVEIKADAMRSEWLEQYRK